MAASFRGKHLLIVRLKRRSCYQTREFVAAGSFIGWKPTRKLAWPNETMGVESNWAMGPRFDAVSRMLAVIFRAVAAPARR